MSDIHNQLSGAVQGPVVQAGSVGSIYLPSEPRYPIPRQLPSPPGFFAGRQSELTDLQQLLTEAGDEPMLAVITGPGGVGKTTLAVQWLRTVRSRFPDGQLYVDLGAFSGAEPTQPEEVLEWFLLTLGLSSDRVPMGLARRAALYRSLTADRAIAVLLDNAFSVAQVRPLLPGSPHSATLVTSRWRLAGLRLGGARFIDVGPLGIDDSVELIKHVVDDERVGSSPEQAEELVRLCAGMPLALSIVGAQLAARPSRSLRAELSDLRHARSLSTLAIEGEPSVEATFDLSYDKLPSPVAKAYRASALHPGSAFGVDVVAAGLDQPPEDVETALVALVERNLLSETTYRRFRFHDLLRMHGRQRAERDEASSVREAIVRRMVEWYLDTTVCADLVLRPTRRRIGPRFRPPPPDPSPFPSRPTALQWLEEERSNITRAIHVAADRGFDQLVWEFCEALWGFLVHTRHYDLWLDVHEIGIPAAQRCGHRDAEARLRTQLCSALVNLRRYGQAREEGTLALELARHEDDQFAVAAVLSELAGCAQGEGDLAGALEYLYQAQAIREVIGTDRALAVCRRRIGEVLCELGRFDEATAALTDAARMLRELGDDPQHARALTSLGTALMRRGRPNDAAAPLALALDLTRKQGLRYYEAAVLATLGDLAEHGGDTTNARVYWSEAREIYALTDDPKTASLTAKLDGPGRDQTSPG